MMQAEEFVGVHFRLTRGSGVECRVIRVVREVDFVRVVRDS